MSTFLVATGLHSFANTCQYNQGCSVENSSYLHASLLGHCIILFLLFQGVSLVVGSYNGEDILVAFGGYNGRYNNEVVMFPAS